MNRVELKEKAKNSLNGNWSEAIKIILVLFLISFVAGAIAGAITQSTQSPLGSLASIAISAAFTFGFISFFLKISRDEEVTYKELFTKTHMWLKFLIATFVSAIIIFVGTILFIIPGIIFAFAISQTFYVILDNPEMGVIDAIKLSSDMMKGYKVDYFVLILSFFGWAILCAFTFGIGFLWLMPYMSVTECNFYNKVKEAYEQKNLSK